MTPNSPYLIGLTGGIASGKSALSKALREAGAFVIDADEISRKLTAEGGAALHQIRALFGDSVFDGERLNRKALSDAVFGNEKALNDLNNLIHPLVFGEMERQIDENKQQKAIILEVPLLYETGYDKVCREVWCAWAPEKAQLERLFLRGLNEDEAKARIKSQMPAMKKALKADRVIITTGQKADNARAIVRLWDSCLRRINRV